MINSRIQVSIFALLLTCTASPHQGSSQQPAFFKLDGLVKVQKKYSIVVNATQGSLPIQITGKTQVKLKLTRPRIDFERKKLIIELPISAADGVFENNKKIEYNLPDRLFITVRFNHERQMNNVMNSAIKRLVSYDLHGADQVNQGVDGALQVSGELVPGNSPDRMRMIVAGQAHDVILGNRDARLIGFSILDLKPHETEVFVSGSIEDGTYFADEVVFASVGDPLTRETPGLPRCLFLGDTISFNYQRPLREALDGVVNLHHPPVNCRGSSGWSALHRWLGPYQEEGRAWDVITFNFGLWDDATPKDEYQENLRKAIAKLRKTGAALIWVSSTPIDYGYNTNSPEGTVAPEAERETLSREAVNLQGKVPGRMRLQNEWAAETLKDFPEIAVCDLWQVVSNGKDSVYKDWWFNKRFTFDYPHAIPLGRSLARHILEALGKSADSIKPTSVHSAGSQELTDKK